ncbi:MAG: hypothetical protein Q9165_007001 [Trypethelium subeluteriae]
MPGQLNIQSPPAPLVVGPTTKDVTRPTDPLPQYLIDEARLAVREAFEPSKHLSFQPPERIMTMQEIGLEHHGISPNAVSEPFQLFTKEAIEQIRAEVFSDEVGTAVVMQGRYIEHQALKALGGRERISMVTCFRPKSPDVRDETVLTGVRGISHKSELYTQYTEYRLEILEERIRSKLKAERLRSQAKKSFDITNVRGWLMKQKDFLEAMLAEIIEE